MSKSDRDAYEKGRESEVSALESSLAAAWINDNKPADGAAGADCSTSKCSGANQCCGVSTPKTGAYVTATLTDICADEATLLYTDGLGRQYNHVCGAQQLLVASAAAIAAFAVLA